MTTAVVLSGGGAKGAFEVGVLKYLYKVQGLRPDIICGTSVGALNAAKLAEGPKDDDQAFDELEAIWRGIRSANDIFLPNPQIAAGIQIIKDAITAEVEEAVLAAAAGAIAGGGLGAFLGFVVGGPIGAIVGGAIGGGLGGAAGAGLSFLDLEEDVAAAIDQAFGHIESLNVLSPLRSLVTQRLDQAAVHNSGIKLRMATVDLNSGGLFYVDQKGDTLTDSRNGAAIHRLEQVKGQVGPDVFQRPAVVKAIDRALASARRPGPLGLVDGVVASAAIPIIFDTVHSGNRLLVDGGVREILPLQAAVDLDATDIVAIQASSGNVRRGLPADALASQFRMVAFIERTFELLANEVGGDDENIDVPVKTNVELIKPFLDIQDTLEFEPEIIALNIFYGFDVARAHFEGTTPLPANVLSLFRELAQLKARLRIRTAGTGLTFGNGVLGVNFMPGLGFFGQASALGGLLASIQTLQVRIQEVTQELNALGAPAVPGLFAPTTTVTVTVPKAPAARSTQVTGS